MRRFVAALALAALVACGEPYSPNGTHGWILKLDGSVTECQAMTVVKSESRSPYIRCDYGIVTTWQEYVFNSFRDRSPWAEGS